MVDIWRLDLTSGERDQLTNTDTREGNIEVSRDGNTLVYEQVREKANLALLDPAAKTPALRMLTSDSLSDLLPSASSSGSVIAFQRAKTLDMSLGLQSATIQVGRDGLATQPVKLTDGYTPEVSADGRWVASAIWKPAAQAELWLTDVHSGKRIPVSNDLLRINYTPFPLQRIGANMVWSPSKTRLFFLAKDSVRGTEVKSATPAADGQTVDVQQVTNINDTAATASDVRVLADGSGLSYLLHRDAPTVTELRVRILTRKEETVYFRDTSSLRLDCPGWLADGDAIVIRWATDTGRADVVLVKSGKAVEIARELQDTHRGSFTLDPSKRGVYFTRQRGTVHSLYSMKLDSGIESLVFQGEPYGPSLSGIRVLADGRLLFSLQAQNHDIVTNKYGR
jgi:Tol biopolymer transport system component